VVDPSLQIACHFQVLGEVGKHFDATTLCNLKRIHVSNCKARSLSLITNVNELYLTMDHYLSDFNCFAQIKQELSITGQATIVGRPPIYDLSCLSPTLESLRLSIKRVANYHFLTNLRHVEFHDCESITDVSCFQNAISVTLTDCLNVVNVNSLAGVKKLILIGCDGVTDISALGRVEEMIISHCEKVQDLSALSTVHTLTVSDFPENLLSPLTQNTVFNLSDFSSPFSSIQFLAGNNLLKVLDISGNGDIRDISMLHTVEVLNINRCSLINSLSGLATLKELHMIKVEGIESGFEVFHQLKKLSIGNVKNKKQIIQALEEARLLSTVHLFDCNLPIDCFSQLTELSLRDCNKLTVFPFTLDRLKSLNIRDCRNLVSFPGFLPSLDDLIIEGSTELSQLRFSGVPNTPPFNRVTVSRCARLEEIEITRRISSLTIRKCPSLQEISGKELVRSFRQEQ
jgi:hypothetical protein